MYVAQVFRENNITITYSSEFDRFPPESYIESVLTKTREEGRSEILFKQPPDRILVHRYALLLHREP